MEGEDFSELKSAVGEHLPDIDRLLAHQDVELSQRPFHAAIFFVEHCILEIQNETKDNFLFKPWFGAIFDAATTWYGERYGVAMSTHKPQSIAAAVQMFSSAFRAYIPLTIRASVETDLTCWVSFPSQLMDGEDTLSWISSPPNFSKANLNELTAVKASLKEVTTRLRSIYVNLLTADHRSNAHRALAQGVIPQLEKAAMDLTHPQANSRSLALWELNFACEKAIKASLIRDALQIPRTHDIYELHQAGLRNVGDDSLDHAVSLLPSGRVAVKHRYSEIPVPGMEECFAVYGATLLICDQYTKAIPRKFVFNNARFKLKMPPWIQQSKI